MAEEFEFTINLEVLPDPKPEDPAEIIRFPSDVFLKIVLEDVAYSEVSVLISRMNATLPSILSETPKEDFELESAGQAYFLRLNVPYYTYGARLSVQVIRRDGSQPGHLHFGKLKVAFSTNNFS